MITSNVECMQFAVNGLRHAQPPVWSFKDSGTWAMKVFVGLKLGVF